MTSPTHGVNKSGRRPIPESVRKNIVLLRSNGLSTKSIAIGLGVGETTVKRYSKSANTVVVKAHKRGDSIIKAHTRGPRSSPVKKTAKPKSCVAELTSEQIEYINNIYRSDYKQGTTIGNFLIRIGKLLGGHDSV